MAELKTFVFTDICGSVRLKNEMVGRSVSERDLAFIHSILTPHRERIERQLHEYGGRVVSTAGDGHFLVFDHTVPAAQWAVDVQTSHREDPITAHGVSPVEVRISIHSGVPQIDPSDPNNFIGKSVDYAARLNDYATGGQILISRSVMAILDDVGLEGLRLHLHGRRNLKGIGAVEVHELLYDDAGPRSMRHQPKSSHHDRQWTIVPTIGFEEGAAAGVKTTVAATAALTHVGNYELLELLGSGGMGDVYKARHTQFGRIRAVKVIKPQFVSAGHAEVIRRFYNEIKAVGRLEHRNIVVAIDSSAPTDSVHYLVMEYIEGVSLDELVAQNGPLPVAEACEVIRQAARGLQFIHKNDMVHRDIKPSNLMLTLVEGDAASGDSTLPPGSEGQRADVKILDLGLALLADDNHDRLTRFDQKAMGTGMYMPPEQWKSTSVDIRADIYSLGCTLYHLLAGNPPFFDSDLRPEKAHEKSAVPAIRSSIQPLPKKLWDVLRKMLEKRPESRYATPAEVVAALAPFAEGHSLPALVRGHRTGEGLSSGLRETQPDGASRVETHRSKPWFSGLDLRPSRRWMLQTALPIGLIAIVSGVALWKLNEQQEATVRRAEEEGRKSLSSFAKHAARESLPKELARRFQVLTTAADDEDLITSLGLLNIEPEDAAAGAEAYPKVARDQITAWIALLANEHNNELVVDSWFVNNEFGVQVARFPNDTSLWKSYRHRDYFHGQAGDVAPEEDLPPIEHNNLSLVYKSSSAREETFKVAFSVPIWDRPAETEETASAATEAAAEDSEPLPPRKVIGVLAMSVKVQDFRVLEEDLAGGSEVVLVDLRDDWIEGEKRHGMILHHPHLAPGKLARLPADVLAIIDQARPLTDPTFDGRNHFIDGPGYADPLNADPTARFWGAFEPVLYEIGDAAPDANAPKDRVGWVVLVQKRKIEE
jgi:serine/threonine protein kinase/class 3 adenylate cyclase